MFVNSSRAGLSHGEITLKPAGRLLTLLSGRDGELSSQVYFFLDCVSNPASPAFSCLCARRVRRADRMSILFSCLWCVLLSCLVTGSSTFFTLFWRQGESFKFLFPREHSDIALPDGTNPAGIFWFTYSY